MGDFNIPRVTWKYSELDDCMLPTCSLALIHEKEFLDGISSAGLSQVSHIMNNHGKALDLVFTTDSGSTSVKRCLAPLLPESSHHPALHISLCFDVNSVNSNTYCNFQFNFKKADFSALEAAMFCANWSSVLTELNVEIASRNFYNIMFNLFLQHVPLTRSKMASKVPWYDADLHNLKNQKAKAWKRYCISRNMSDYARYSDLSNLFVIRSRTAYDEYVDNMKSTLKTDPKLFWKFVNSKRCSDGYPTSLSFSGISSDDPLTVSNMFCDYFQAAFDDCNQNTAVNDFDYMTNLPQTTLQEKDLFIDDASFAKHVADISSNSFGPGPDGIPACILKNCRLPLSPILCYLFNLSVTSGVFPTIWKHSLIIPLHKKGAKNEVCNYRPIANLAAIGKLFESIVVDVLYFHCKSLIGPFQHGFTKGRSTSTNLTEFTSSVIGCLENGKQVDCIYTDFSKAFDRLSHKILILKLGLLGFPSTFIRWVTSYLTGRIQKVLFRGSLSQEIFNTSGVPQGSHLGPLLFVLFINDASLVLSHSRVLIYADDTKIFREIQCVNDCLLLNSDLSKFYEWCLLNRLPLNVNKCSSMSFFRKKYPIDFVYAVDTCTLTKLTKIKDLGVIFNRTLTFDDHIDYTISRANAILGFVKRWAKEFNDPYVTKSLYITFVRSILEYASVVWDPCYAVHITRVESVQRRFLRFALKDLPWDNPLALPSYLQRLNLLSLVTLERRRKCSKILFMFKILSGAIDCPFLTGAVNINIPPRSFRNYVLLNVPHHRTNYGFNEPISSMCRLFNAHYDIIDFNMSIVQLKNQLSLIIL